MLSLTGIKRGEGTGRRTLVGRENELGTLEAVVNADAGLDAGLD